MFSIAILRLSTTVLDAWLFRLASKILKSAPSEIKTIMAKRATATISSTKVNPDTKDFGVRVNPSLFLFFLIIGLIFAHWLQFLSKTHDLREILNILWPEENAQEDLLCFRHHL